MEFHFSGFDTAGWTVRIELSSNNAPALCLTAAALFTNGYLYLLIERFFLKYNATS